MEKVSSMLDMVSYPTLIPLAVLLALAPFVPQPHLLEKIIMLKNGALHKPIDIFDLFMHATPLAFLMAKLAKDYVFR